MVKKKYSTVAMQSRGYETDSKVEKELDIYTVSQ